MKIRFVLFLLLWAPFAGLTQPPQKLSREEKRLIREYEEEQETLLADSLLRIRRFVLEASRLQDKYGRVITVTPTLNFVSVDSQFLVAQVGDQAAIGRNGFGGFTFEGEIVSWEERTNKKGQGRVIELLFRGIAGSFRIVIYWNSTLRASAVLYGNWGGSITYTGKLVPVGESRVYKGMSTP